MYDRTEAPRIARRQAEALPGRNPLEAARRALERVRRTLDAPSVPAYRSMPPRFELRSRMRCRPLTLPSPPQGERVG